MKGITVVVMMIRAGFCITAGPHTYLAVLYGI